MSKGKRRVFFPRFWFYVAFLTGISFVSAAFAGKTFSISSMRNDGSHKEEIFASPHPLCCPAIQPFNKKLTFSMKNEKSFHIFTFLK